MSFPVKVRNPYCRELAVQLLMFSFLRETCQPLSGVLAFVLIVQYSYFNKIHIILFLFLLQQLAFEYVLTQGTGKAKTIEMAYESSRLWQSCPVSLKRHSIPS